MSAPLWDNVRWGAFRWGLGTHYVTIIGVLISTAPIAADWPSAAPIAAVVPASPTLLGVVGQPTVAGIMLPSPTIIAVFTNVYAIGTWVVDDTVIGVCGQTLSIAAEAPGSVSIVAGDTTQCAITGVFNARVTLDALVES